MSATNRTRKDGNTTERAEGDFYRTAGWVTRSLAPYLPPIHVGEPLDGWVRRPPPPTAGPPTAGPPTAGPPTAGPPTAGPPTAGPQSTCTCGWPYAYVKAPAVVGAPLACQKCVPRKPRKGGGGPPTLVVDAGAGDGAIADALPYPIASIACVETNEALGAACLAKGYVTHLWDWTTHRNADLIVSNPPFSEALAFIEHGLSLIAREPPKMKVFRTIKSGMAQETTPVPIAMAAFLLRLNFLEGQARAAFHRAHPAHVLVLPRRPSFTGGGTDATGYAWMLWGTNPGATKPIVANRWDILDIEPHERKVRKLDGAGHGQKRESEPEEIGA